MVKRIKVGIIYTYNKDWVAGAYYILNLIQALNVQPDEEKPELYVLSYKEEEFKTIQETGYPYLKFILLEDKKFWASYSLIERVINKVSRTFFKKDIFYREHTKDRLRPKPDVLFPATLHVYFSDIKHKLFWVPDFQEHFLPQFFTEEDRNERKKYQLQLAAQNSTIVFSSMNAQAHFKQIYPQSPAKTFVLPFAVTHPAYKHLSITDLKTKFSIDKPYFFCPNQFWIHKNHIIVLKAINQLKEQGVTDFLVAFSGKEKDYRNPGFFDQLKAFVATNKLEEYVRFLGFIDRDEQLQLMNNAVSVIQPSLFEGWSTVVEDAKAMNQFVIASHLDVHKEQLKSNAIFFDPADAVKLGIEMKNALVNPFIKTKNKYDQQVQQFGRSFIAILKQLKE